MRGLIVAGGLSSRMKTEKALLELEGQSLIERLSLSLRDALGDPLSEARSTSSSAPPVSISLRKEALTIDLAQRLKLEPLYDAANNIGPASALLAAHALDPQETWIVVACDFPFVDSSCLRRLISAHSTSRLNTEVTCYGHDDGTPEPLLAIWTPSALKKLDENVKLGLRGPIATLKKCQFIEVDATDPRWLINVNTPEDWEKAKAAYSTTNLSSPKTR